MRKGIDKKYAKYGLPFVDYRVDLRAPSKNVVIYAHNMGKEDDMFGTLKYYNRYDRYCNNSAKKAIDFYKEHAIINFDTVYGPARYRIFAVLILDGEKVDFNFSHFMESAHDFNEFINQAKNRSLMNIGADVNTSDDFLTLSTCSYELASGKLRLVVIARKLRAGESDDPSPVENNKEGLMPPCWYDVYGGTPPKFDRKDYNITAASAASEPVDSAPPQVQRKAPMKKIKDRKLQVKKK
jgi:hypothetical protein